MFRQSVITVRAVSYAKTNIAKYGLLSLPPGSLNHTQEAPLPICHILTRVPPPLSLTGDTYVCGIHLFQIKAAGQPRVANEMVNKVTQCAKAAGAIKEA